jgi:hypothetical protein
VKIKSALFWRLTVPYRNVAMYAAMSSASLRLSVCVEQEEGELFSVEVCPFGNRRE